MGDPSCAGRLHLVRSAESGCPAHRLRGEDSLCARLIATRSLDEQVTGIKDLIADHERRIRNGILAYERLQRLRGGDKSSEAIAAFNEVKGDLGYGLLLKKYTADVVDATDEQIKQAALDTIPDVFSLFWTFRVMVASGFLMLLLFALASWASIKRDAESKPWLLRFALFSLPLPWIAAQTGWYVAEHGRQPGRSARCCRRICPPRRWLRATSGVR